MFWPRSVAFNALERPLVDTIVLTAGKENVNIIIQLNWSESLLFGDAFNGMSRVLVVWDAH